MNSNRLLAVLGVGSALVAFLVYVFPTYSDYCNYYNQCWYWFQDEPARTPFIVFFSAASVVLLIVRAGNRR